MIRYRKGAYEIVVNVGNDPVTGKRRTVSRSIRGPERKRIPREVLDAEAKLRAEVGAGQHGSPSITVSDLLDRWLAHVRAGLSPTTLHGYEQVIRLYLKPHLGTIRLAKLTTARLDGFYRTLSETPGARGAPLAPATVRQAHAVLRRALHQAQRWGWIAMNPAALADPPSVKRPPIEAPSAEQIAHLIATAEPDLAFLIRLAAGTGMRRAELCGLRWADVDLDGQTLLVVRTVNDIEHALVEKGPKSGKPRRVMLGPNLTDALRDRRKVAEERAVLAGVKLGDGWVLSDALDGSEPLHPNLASDRFRRHARAQEEPMRLHDLRHAKASLSLDAGLPPNDIAEQLGWASTKMLFDTYGHARRSGHTGVGEVLDL